MNIDVFPLSKLGPAGDEVIKTSGFGPRGGRNHNGCDYGTVLGRLNGAPIHAPFAGVVNTGYEAGGAGNWVWVTADDGRRFKGFHLSRFEQQTRVEAGDIVGYVGTTGASSGPHLHAELWQGGQLIDCEPVFDAAFNEGRFPGSTPDVPEEEEDDMPPYSQWAQEDKDALASDVWAAVSGEKRAQAQGGLFAQPNRLALDDLPSDLEALKLAIGTVQKILEGKG